MKIIDVPCQAGQWRREHPGEDIPDGHVFTQRWPAGPASKRRDKVIYYNYKADRARRTLAVSRWIEARTGWSIGKFVRPGRRYRTIQIQAGPRAITAADPRPRRPPPGDPRCALT